MSHFYFLLSFSRGTCRISIKSCAAVDFTFFILHPRSAMLCNLVCRNNTINDEGCLSYKKNHHMVVRNGSHLFYDVNSHDISVNSAVAMRKIGDLLSLRKRMCHFSANMWYTSRLMEGIIVTFKEFSLPASTTFFFWKITSYFPTQNFGLYFVSCAIFCWFKNVRHARLGAQSQ